MNDATDLARLVRRLVDDAFQSAFPAAPGAACPVGLRARILAIAEKPLIEMMLARNSGNQSWTAEQLGINRNTLRKLMRRHGITAEPEVKGAPRSYFGPKPALTEWRT